MKQTITPLLARGAGARAAGSGRHRHAVRDDPGLPRVLRLRCRHPRGAARGVADSPLKARTKRSHAMKTFLMLHGINHNMFGKRDPKQYGTITLSRDRRPAEGARQGARRHGRELPDQQRRRRCASASTEAYADKVGRRADQRRRLDALQLRHPRRAGDPDRADRRDPHVERPRARGVPPRLGVLGGRAAARSAASASTAICSACAPRSRPSEVARPDDGRRSARGRSAEKHPGQFRRRTGAAAAGSATPARRARTATSACRR